MTVNQRKPGPERLAIEERIAGIRLIVFDFDGVFTDNRVLVGDDGSEYVLCNRADGLGLENLRRHGIECLVLSRETNPVVAKRCEKLKLDYIQGCADKWETLRKILGTKKIDPSQAGYVGNDINDLACMENVGLAFSVVDAYPEVKSAAHYVTLRGGGQGAVREICDLIVRARKKDC